MSEPIHSGRSKIAIRGLHKSFGPKVVLDGAELDVAQGESLVIIGGSGTGKSVLLKHVIGLLRPDSGTIQVDGQAVETLVEITGNIAAPQAARVSAAKTILDFAVKGVELVDLAERVEALEQASELVAQRGKGGRR